MLPRTPDPRPTSEDRSSQDEEKKRAQVQAQQQEQQQQQQQQEQQGALFASAVVAASALSASSTDWLARVTRAALDPASWRSAGYTMSQALGLRRLQDLVQVRAWLWGSERGCTYAAQHRAGSVRTLPRRCRRRQRGAPRPTCNRGTYPRPPTNTQNRRARRARCPTGHCGCWAPTTACAATTRATRGSRQRCALDNMLCLGGALSSGRRCASALAHSAAGVVRRVGNCSHLLTAC